MLQRMQNQCFNFDKGALKRNLHQQPQKKKGGRKRQCPALCEVCLRPSAISADVTHAVGVADLAPATEHAEASLSSRHLRWYLLFWRQKHACSRHMDNWIFLPSTLSLSWLWRGALRSCLLMASSTGSLFREWVRSIGLNSSSSRFHPWSLSLPFFVAVGAIFFNAPFFDAVLRDFYFPFFPTFQIAFFEKRELATHFSFLCMSSTVCGSNSWSFAIIGEHSLEVWQRALRMTDDTDAANSSKLFFPFFACFLIFLKKAFSKNNAFNFPFLHFFNFFTLFWWRRLLMIAWKNTQGPGDLAISKTYLEPELFFFFCQPFWIRKPVFFLFVNLFRSDCHIANEGTLLPQN